MTRIMSMPSSSATISMAFSYRLGSSSEATPVSVGLPTDVPTGGSTSRRRATVFSASARQLQPERVAVVGGADAGPALAADDRDPAALGQRQVVEGHGAVDDLRDAGDVDDAGLLEHRVPDARRAGQRAGVRGGRPGALLAHAALPQDDGLLAADLAGHLEEAPAVLDALHVGDDGLGLLVLAEVLQVVLGGQVALVAAAHDGAEAQALGRPGTRPGSPRTSRSGRSRPRSPARWGRPS